MFENPKIGPLLKQADLHTLLHTPKPTPLGLQIAIISSNLLSYSSKVAIFPVKVVNIAIGNRCPPAWALWTSLVIASLNSVANVTFSGAMVSN